MTLLKTIWSVFSKLLSLLKLGFLFAPFLWVFSKLAAVLKFVPGGSFLGIFSGIFSAFTWFFKWAGADFIDGFKQPQRMVARIICFAIMLGIGVYCGMRYDDARVAQVTATLDKMVADLKKANTDDQAKLNAALAAKRQAEQDALRARAAVVAPQPAPAAVAPAAPTAPAAAASAAPAPAAQPKRVHHPKNDKGAAGQSSWMHWF